jgi:hypothetical protein
MRVFKKRVNKVGDQKKDNSLQIIFNNKKSSAPANSLFLFFRTGLALKKACLSSTHIKRFAGA